MAVEFIDLGQHKNVFSVTFGRNDVFISSAFSNDGRAMIMFYTNNDDLKSEDFVGADLNDLPFPEAVLMFEDPHTMSSLMQLILECQKSFFK
jgi:hypothetical protein